MPACLGLATVWSYTARQTERDKTKRGLHIATLTALALSFLFWIGVVANKALAADLVVRPLVTTAHLTAVAFVIIDDSIITLSFIALGYYCSPCRQLDGELPRRQDNVNMREERMMVVV